MIEYAVSDPPIHIQYSARKKQGIVEKSYIRSRFWWIMGCTCGEKV